MKEKLHLNKHLIGKNFFNKLNLQKKKTFAYNILNIIKNDNANKETVVKYLTGNIKKKENLVKPILIH